MNLGELFNTTKVSDFSNGDKIDRVKVTLVGDTKEREYVVARNEEYDYVAMSEVVEGEETNLFLYTGEEADKYFGKEKLWLFKPPLVLVKRAFVNLLLER